MKIPLHLLQSLVVTAEASSMAKAAAQLNLTQAALSMQLRKLQESFPLPIFEFQGKRKVLTPYGRSCYAEAKRLIQEFQLSFENVNRRYLDPAGLTLRVGGRRELLALVQKKLFFAGRIVLEPMSSVQAIQGLESREIDVAVSRLKPDSPYLVAKKLVVSSPRLVMNKRWLKKGDPKRVLSDTDFLRRTPVIIYDQSAEVMTDWLAHLGMSLDQLNVRYICADWLAILQMVESGVGYSVMPDTIQSNLSNVLSFELPKTVVRSETYYFLYNKGFGRLPAFKGIWEQSAIR